MPDRCDRCRYFYPNPPAQQPGYISFCGDEIYGGGYCRKKPPVIRESPHEMAGYPLVACDSWCGAFEAFRSSAPPSHPVGPQRDLPAE